jgi:inward rectifier potassium channel
MEKPAFDPGLTQQYIGTLKRALNPNGQFNVRRTGATWRDAHPYLFLIGTSWPSFVGALLAVFFVVNLFFTALYLAIGVEHLKGAESRSVGSKILAAFFFNRHADDARLRQRVPKRVAANSVWPPRKR